MQAREEQERNAETKTCFENNDRAMEYEIPHDENKINEMTVTWGRRRV